MWPPLVKCVRNEQIAAGVLMPAHSSGRGWQGENRIFVPDVPHLTRYVPGVKKHNGVVISVRYGIHSQLT